MGGAFSGIVDLRDPKGRSQSAGGSGGLRVVKTFMYRNIVLNKQLFNSFRGEFESRGFHLWLSCARVFNSQVTDKQ